MTDPHDYDFDGDDDEGIVVHTPRDSGLGNDLLDGSEFDFLTSVPEDEGSRSAGEYFIAHPDSPIIEMGGDDDEFLLSAEAPNNES